MSRLATLPGLRPSAPTSAGRCAAAKFFQLLMALTLVMTIFVLAAFIPPAYAADEASFPWIMKAQLKLQCRTPFFLPWKTTDPSKLNV
jgi:hypothetical protein